MGWFSVDNLTSRIDGGPSDPVTLDDFSIGNAVERVGVEVEDDPNRMDLNDFTIGNAVSRLNPWDSAQQGDGSEPFDSSDFDTENIGENTGNIGDAVGGSTGQGIESLGRLAQLVVENIGGIVAGVVGLVVIYVIGQLFTVNIGDSTQ